VGIPQLLGDQPFRKCWKSVARSSEGRNFWLREGVGRPSWGVLFLTGVFVSGSSGPRGGRRGDGANNNSAACRLSAFYSVKQRVDEIGQNTRKEENGSAGESKR